MKKLRKEMKIAGAGRVSLLLFASMANVAFGGEAVLNRNDVNANPSAFNGLPAYWTPNVNPASADGASTDFVVKNGLALRTPDGNTGALAFGGKSLTLGAVDRSSKGSVYYKSNGYKITIPNLIVYRGGISSSTSFTSGGYNTYVAGAATLYTTPDDPFAFTFDTRVSKPAFFDWVLTGDETTAVSISGATKGAASKITLRKSQAKTYSGSWIFGENQYFYVDGGIKEGDAFVFTTSQTVFGKALSAFNPQAIRFGDGCQFRYEARERTLPAADNRGITVADNGTLTFILVNRITIDCGYPIAGNGAAAVLTGDGTLKLRANSTVLLKPLGTAKLALAGTAAANGGIEIGNGQAVTVGEAATDRVAVCGADLTDATFKFAVASDGGDAARLRLSGAVTVSGKIGLAFSEVPSVSATKDIPVIVIDKDVARTFTEADFDPWGVPGAQIPNAERVTVARNADGDQVVSVRVFPFVRSNRGYNVRAYFKNANEWTPNGVVSAGHNYIAWNNPVQTGETDGKTIVAPGDRWVFYNTAPADTSVHFVSKERKMTFYALRLLDNTGFATAKQASNWTMEWAGNYDIRTTESGFVYFENSGMAGAIVSASLSGIGRVLARGTGSKGYDCRLTLSGDNAGYAGTFASSNTTTDATCRCLVLEASSETNFGGNPAAFAADAWRLGARVAFTPTAAVTIDDANRGVTLENGSEINTAENCDFTVKTPMVVEGGFTKRGPGTFAFGAGGLAAPAAAWSIAVEGGAIKPQNAAALQGATVSFADGAVLAVDAATGALDLTTTTLRKSGEKFRVKIDGLAGTVPVATFASEEEAAEFVANAVTVKGTRARGRLQAEGATVKAHVPGLVITVR